MTRDTDVALVKLGNWRFWSLAPLCLMSAACIQQVPPPNLSAPLERQVLPTPPAGPSIEECRQIKKAVRQTAADFARASQLIEASPLLGGLVADRQMEQALEREYAVFQQIQFETTPDKQDYEAGHRALIAARDEIHEIRVQAEDGLRKFSASIRDARTRAWKLRETCEETKKRDAGCRAILKALPEREIEAWEDDTRRDLVISKLQAMNVKGSYSSELEWIRTALVEASRVAGAPPKEKSSLDRAQLRDGFAAIERIEARCGAAPLAPVDWVSSSTTDLRAITTLVRPLLAPTIRDILPENLRGGGGPLGTGVSGSGVVVVRMVGNDQRSYVVTNHHVVGQSESAMIDLPNGTSRTIAAVRYSDPVRDLAILEIDPRSEGAERFSVGVGLEQDPVNDQQSVIAAGFPGMGDRPSYQVTRGHVSNREILIDDFYVQHSAPTDPGSSGGPLLSEAGRLIGINTMKIQGREGVSIAIPAAQVEDAFLTLDRSPREASEEDARYACMSIIAAISQEQIPLSTVRRAVTNGFIAENGSYVYNALLRDLASDRVADLKRVLAENPLDTLTWLSFERLLESIRRAGGLASTEICDAAAVTSSAGALSATFSLNTRRSPISLSLVRDRSGTFRIDGFTTREPSKLPGSFVNPAPHPPATILQQTLLRVSKRRSSLSAVEALVASKSKTGIVERLLNVQAIPLTRTSSPKRAITRTSKGTRAHPR